MLNMSSLIGVLLKPVRYPDVILEPVRSKHLRGRLSLLEPKLAICVEDAIAQQVMYRFVEGPTLRKVVEVRL